MNQGLSNKIAKNWPQNLDSEIRKKRAITKEVIFDDSQRSRTKQKIDFRN